MRELLDSYGFTKTESILNEWNYVRSFCGDDWLYSLKAEKGLKGASFTTAVMCGIDTDCNAGTAGSIVGAAVGREGVESRWLEPLNDTIRSGVACFGTCAISDIVDRICKLSEKNV